MDRKIFHGNITPDDIANALMASFHRGNLRTQLVGDSDNRVVQIATRQGSQSGGLTAMTISISKVEDGVMVQIGSQSWLGVAASMGTTAISVLFNPWNIINRLDDIAQDIESLQMADKAWQVINRTVQSAGASTQISERLQRLECEYCGTANTVGTGSCVACGGPLGKIQPRTCAKCGFVTLRGEQYCPSCGKSIP
jgi:hypothetical protein